ncbi:hypothetical protein F7R91_05515 [Streptomyces luteolifulvus]|uniref:Uncharacterized protein n=1 Tax=Streptomyces luteolifulvus TaxID=2615112 RepID=A0A6H9V6Q6_9ACTN|nr:hypothetical protein [Streptomyces luteolifulvus]KAB1149217.1 hypothetical protein F7R91_05515 [Streptomyces luteolifulvus]
MAHRPIRREHRATRRALRATLRRRAAETRLVSSCRRRPRSITTVAIAAGIDRDTASGCANGLRSVAKRLGVTPALTARTRRTACGGRARQTHTVHRYTLRQVARLVANYRPRKAEYVTAAARIAAFAAAA